MRRSRSELPAGHVLPHDLATPWLLTKSTVSHKKTGPNDMA